MNKKQSERLSKILRSSSVEDASEALVARIGDIKYPTDDIEEDINILRIMERTFCTKNKGLKLNVRDVKKWPELFDKCENIFEISAPNLSLYAQVILRETIGHRYSDFFKLRKKKEDKLNESYGLAFDISDKQNFYSHKDASSFWNGTAYMRCGKIAKAAPFFARVVNNRLSFNQIRMHRLKVEASFSFFIEYPLYTPDNISEGLSALIEQNKRFKDMFGPDACVPEPKMKSYIERWLK